MYKCLQTLNLTQHDASAEQKEAGVVDLPENMKGEARECLTFHEIPDKGTIVKRAIHLATMAEELNYSSAMIGGAPFLMSELEKALIYRGIRPLYAFSRRESVEETLPDGSVKKVNVFRHEGFVDLIY